MEESAEKPRPAWQPLTPRGVAAFSRASLSRLWAVQLVVALLAAVAVVWLLYGTWFVTIGRAIGGLPEEGEFRDGRLDWRGQSPVTLAEGRCLALTVDLNHQGQLRSPAHIQIEFGQSSFKVFSLLGYVEGDYPRGWRVAFNHAALQPWWGAWSPALLAIAGALVVVMLLVSWSVLATLYALPAWLVGFFGDRDLAWRQSWRLAGAALLPGALFMSGALVMYGLGGLDLVRLAVAAAVHLALGWIYLVVGVLQVPRHPSAQTAKPNPFRS